MSNAVFVAPRHLPLRLGFAAPRRAVVGLAAVALTAAAAGGLPTLRPTHRSGAAAVPAGSAISALSIVNSAQHLRATFGSGGANVSSHGARFTLGLTAFGRGAQLQPVAPVRPQLAGGMVRYAESAAVTQTWRNGPLGLEQGFVLSQRPAGTGPVTAAMSAPAGSLLVPGAVSLPGGLRYAGLRATDARGHVLHSWLALERGQLLIKVSDRGASYPVQIDPLVSQANLTANDGVVGDYFGNSVAISGHTLVAGAPYHGNEQGAVYVFANSSGHWKRTAELTVSGKPDQEFGMAVAISGDTIVASAPYAGANSQGALYVFKDSSGHWNQVAQLTASDAGLSDQLGRYSIAIQGKTIIAGSPAHSVGSANAQGAVYVFNEPAAGWQNATQSAELTGAHGGFIGWSVAISGNTIVAGAPGGNKTALFVFTQASGHWKQTAVLHQRDVATIDDIGHAVAISGHTIAAATQGDVYVFHSAAGKWKQTEVSGTSDGAAVAFDGSAILASAANTIPAKSGVYPAGIAEFRAFAGKWRQVTSASIGHDPSKQGALNESLASTGDTIVAGLFNGDDAGSVVVLKGRVTSEGPLIGTINSGTAGKATVPVACELPRNSTCRVTIIAHRARSKQVLGHAKPKNVRGTEIRTLTVDFNAAFEHLLAKPNGVNVKFTVRETLHGKVKASGSTTIHFILE